MSIQDELTEELDKIPTIQEYAKELEEVQSIDRVYEGYDEALSIASDINSDTYDLPSNISNSEELPEDYVEKFDNKEEAFQEYEDTLEQLQEADNTMSKILNKEMTDEWKEDINEDRQSRGDIPDGDEDY